MGQSEAPAERLCGMCHAIWVTEGEIPTYCSHCDPPRLSPSAKRLVALMMIGSSDD